MLLLNLLLIVFQHFDFAEPSETKITMDMELGNPGIYGNPVISAALRALAWKPSSNCHCLPSYRVELYA